MLSSFGALQRRKSERLKTRKTQGNSPNSLSFSQQSTDRLTPLSYPPGGHSGTAQELERVSEPLIQHFVRKRSWGCTATINLPTASSSKCGRRKLVFEHISIHERSLDSSTTTGLYANVKKGFKQWSTYYYNAAYGKGSASKCRRKEEKPKQEISEGCYLIQRWRDWRWSSWCKRVS